jgi:hypothetical protein
MESLINGPMKEAGERSVESSDISIDDFIRFCEYAYCGNYTTPSFILDVARAAGTTIKRHDISEHTPADKHNEAAEPEQSPQDDV